MQNMQVRVFSGRPAQRKSAPRLCNTCLAADRELSFLQKTPDIVNILSEIALTETSMICFECRARLHGFIRFRSRALHAGMVLSRGILKGKTVNFKTLSTLTRSCIAPDDTIYVNSDSVEVKLEASDELQIKEEDFLLPVTIEAVSEPVLEKLEDDDSMTDVKSEPRDNDDLQSDVDSEKDDEVQQRYDPDVTSQYTTKQIDLKEVLSHLEDTRNSARYKGARHKCHDCAQIFTTEALYRSHTRRHSESNGRFRCEVCGLRYRDGKKLRRHSAGHYSRHECRHCARRCFSYSQMYYHYKNMHDETTPRQCSKCAKTFKTKRELTQHNHRVHGRKHPCPQCNRQYATSDGLQRHSLVHDVKVPELECGVCHKKYKGEYKLKVHGRVHEVFSEDAYCPECDIRFKSPHHYRRHLASGRHVPVEDYKFECDYCGQRCVQKATLRTHIEQRHLRLSRYKCQVCQESFHTAWVLKRHHRVRHTERPPAKRHVCYVCQKDFRLRKSLDEHMNTHLGVRPFECQLCAATFVYSAALYNHNQLVHLKKKRGKRNNKNKE